MNQLSLLNIPVEEVVPTLQAREDVAAQTKAAMVHRCHAKDCTQAVPPKMLMCKHHWAMVPKHLQRAVWQHYRAGQEVTKDPSPEYLAAAQNAIDAVYFAENPPPESAKPLEHEFAVGDIVLVAAISPSEKHPFMAAGKISGLLGTDFLQVMIGQNQPYACCYTRLTKYSGTLSLWRLGSTAHCDREDCKPRHNIQPFDCSVCGDRSQPEWFYTGTMSLDQDLQPKWPDAMWFPADYDPNTKEFYEDKRLESLR